MPSDLRSVAVYAPKRDIRAYTGNMEGGNDVRFGGRETSGI